MGNTAVAYEPSISFGAHEVALELNAHQRNSSSFLYSAIKEYRYTYVIYTEELYMVYTFYN